jgi:hypothetical protein
MNYRFRTMLCGLAVLYGCADKVTSPSVQDCLADPIALEAAMVRCAANRAETRYDAECVNARQAVSVIEARKDRERRDLFEAESAAKRAALRRTQQAAAEARRRAKEAERQRREAEYLAQFGESPPPEELDGEVYDTDETAINAPGAVLPPAPELAPSGGSEVAPAVDGGNAPAVQARPTDDLNAVREELRRRSEESGY